MTFFQELRRLAVEVHREDGTFWAEVLELPGCFASGDTKEELEEALAEAVSLYLTNEGVTVTVQRLVLDSDPQLDAGHYEAELVPA
jgi:predicted RNase H-like HicB family nuclease